MNEKHFLKEIRYEAVKSEGKGGQNVNKVATKVKAYWNMADSVSLDEKEKLKIRKKLAKKISAGGEIIVDSQESRSQFANKKIATEKLLKLITQGLLNQKRRISTEPSAAKKLERLKQKKIHGEVKQQRRKPISSDE